MLSLYEVRNADLYEVSIAKTKKQSAISVKYIIYSAAQICMDFRKIEIKCKDDSPHCYAIKLPEPIVERARVLHDGKESTRIWNVEAPSNMSVLSLENGLKQRVEKEIIEKAQQPERMKKARDQAKRTVEAMIRAGDKDATFEYLP